MIGARIGAMCHLPPVDPTAPTDGAARAPDQNSGRRVLSEKVRRRGRDEVDPQPFQHIMTGELDGQVTSEAIGALGNDRPDLQGDADQPVRYVEVPRKAEVSRGPGCSSGRQPWPLSSRHRTR